MRGPTTFAPNETWEYLPGRRVHRGEQLRISGGPVWVDAGGSEHRIGERGVYTFCFHTEDRKGTPYIVASGDAGASVVFILKPRRPKYGLRGWKNKPYRFTKVRAR